MICFDNFAISSFFFLFQKQHCFSLFSEMDSQYFCSYFWLSCVLWCVFTNNQKTVRLQVMSTGRNCSQTGVNCHTIFFSSAFCLSLHLSFLSLSDFCHTLSLCRFE